MGQVINFSTVRLSNMQTVFVVSTWLVMVSAFFNCNRKIMNNFVIMQPTICLDSLFCVCSGPYVDFLLILICLF